MVVEIFKTNVQSRKQATSLLRLLQDHFPLAESNFDLEDCDCILRIKAEKICPVKIACLLVKQGFECSRIE